MPTRRRARKLSGVSDVKAFYDPVELVLVVENLAESTLYVGMSPRNPCNIGWPIAAGETLKIHMLDGAPVFASR